MSKPASVWGGPCLHWENSHLSCNQTQIEDALIPSRPVKLPVLESCDLPWNKNGSEAKEDKPDTTATRKNFEGYHLQRSADLMDEFVTAKISVVAFC